MPDIEPQIMSVAKVRERCDPFATICWADLDRPITLAEVTAVVSSDCGPREALAHHANLQQDGSSAGCPIRRRSHIDRIARFVIEGWEDPIGIDVGVPSLGCNPAWIIDDGNHRFAAAIVRGDDTIAVSASGIVSGIDALCD